MSPEKIGNVLRVLNMIKKDIESDVTEMDGKPFTGKTVATQFGNQGAAICALVDMVKAIVSD